MANGKTTTLTFRIEPRFKDALRAAAEREHRSIANMVEVLIRDHCARAGILITGSSTRVSNGAGGKDDTEGASRGAAAITGRAGRQKQS